MQNKLRISFYVYIGASATLIIVLLIIKKQRMQLTPHQDVDLQENGAYGISLSMRLNDAYGCSSNEEQHIYEEIAESRVELEAHGSA